MTAMAEDSNGRRGSRVRILLWGIAAALILTPAVAMRFTSEVNWTAFDFVFATVLIGGTGLLVELAVRASRSWAFRGGVVAALAAAFLLIWVNGAVGIIGDEDNPANLLYFGVIAISLLGAVAARFRSAGMALAMAAAAAAQAAIALYALIAGLGAAEPPGPFGILVLNGFFVVLYLVSAGLFRMAALDHARLES